MIDVQFARTAADLEEVFSLRYRAYAAQGWIQPMRRALLDDALDETEGVESLLAREDGRAVGTMRVIRRRSTESLAKFESYSKWAAEIGREVGDSASAEINRFAVAPECQGLVPYKVKFALLKTLLAHLVTERIPLCLGSVRREHLDFYTRLLGMTCLSEARPVGALAFDAYLVLGRIESSFTRIAERAPALAPNASDLTYWREMGALRV